MRLMFTPDQLNTMYLAIDNIEQANKNEMTVIQTIHNHEVKSMCKIIKLKLREYAKAQLTGLV